MARPPKDIIEAADKLLAMMKTPGWTTRIWYNMGWNYEVENGPLTVDAWNGGYICGLSYEHQKAIPTDWHDEKTYDDPNKAVRGQLKIAREYARTINKHIKETENRLKVATK